MRLLEFTKKSSANNYKRYQKLIHYVSKRCVNKQVSFLNAAVVCNTSEFWRVSFSKTATALRNTLFSDINISQGSVAELWNFRSLELSFPGTFAPGSESSKNFRSLEPSLPGTFAPGSKIRRTFAPTPSDFRSRHSFMDMYAYAVTCEF